MNKPYVTSDGDKLWYDKEDRLHRVDGPAVEYAHGDYSWYLEGEYIQTAYEHYKLIQEVKDMPLVLRLVDPRRWVREFK